MYKVKNCLTLIVNLRPIYACFWQILITTNVNVIKIARHVVGDWNKKDKIVLLLVKLWTLVKLEMIRTTYRNKKKQ